MLRPSWTQAQRLVALSLSLSPALRMLAPHRKAPLIGVREMRTPKRVYCRDFESRLDRKIQYPQLWTPQLPQGHIQGQKRVIAPPLHASQPDLHRLRWSITLKPAILEFEDY